MTQKKLFATRKKNQKKTNRRKRTVRFDKSKRTLFKVGHHLIDIDDILTVSCVKKNLYIIKLKSNPNPEFPIWANTAEVMPLLKQFNIANADGTDKYERGEDRRPNAFSDHPDNDRDDMGDPSDFG